MYEKKRGPKSQQGSYATIIKDVLMNPEIKDVDKAVEEVLKLKPGRESKNVKSQIRAITRHVKNNTQSRWKYYVWDEENFLLTEDLNPTDKVDEEECPECNVIKKPYMEELLSLDEQKEKKEKEEKEKEEDTKMTGSIAFD